MLVACRAGIIGSPLRMPPCDSSCNRTRIPLYVCARTRGTQCAWMHTEKTKGGELAWLFTLSQVQERGILSPRGRTSPIASYREDRCLCVMGRFFLFFFFILPSPPPSSKFYPSRFLSRARENKQASNRD